MFAGPHYMTISPSTPDYLWINTSYPSTTLVVDFDGNCSVSPSFSPENLTIQSTVSGQEMHITISMITSSGSYASYGFYELSLIPTHDSTTYDMVTQKIYAGRRIYGLNVSKPFIQNHTHTHQLTRARAHARTHTHTT